jgi:hypothetical protein
LLRFMVLVLSVPFLGGQLWSEPRRLPHGFRF